MSDHTQPKSKCCNARIKKATEPEAMLGVPDCYCSKCGSEYLGESEEEQGAELHKEAYNTIMNKNSVEEVVELRKKLAMYFYNAEYPEVYTKEQVIEFENEVNRVMSIFNPFITNYGTAQYNKGERDGAERERERIENIIMKIPDNNEKDVGICYPCKDVILEVIAIRNPQIIKYLCQTIKKKNHQKVN